MSTNTDAVRCPACGGARITAEYVRWPNADVYGDKCEAIKRRCLACWHVWYQMTTGQERML